MAVARGTRRLRFIKPKSVARVKRALAPKRIAFLIPSPGRTMTNSTVRVRVLGNDVPNPIRF